MWYLVVGAVGFNAWYVHTYIGNTPVRMYGACCSDIWSPKGPAVVSFIELTDCPLLLKRPASTSLCTSIPMYGKAPYCRYSSTLWMQDSPPSIRNSGTLGNNNLALFESSPLLPSSPFQSTSPM